MSKQFYYCDECGHDSGSSVSRLEGDWHAEDCPYYRKPYVDWGLNPNEVPAWYAGYLMRRVEEAQRQETMRKVEAMYNNKAKNKT